MFAYGAGGMLAGFCFAKKRLARDPVNMAIFGFFAVMLWVGPLMDVSSVFLTLSSITWKSAALIMTAAFPVNLVQGITTAVVLGLLGRPLLGKLERIQIKYGMMGDQDAQ